MIDEELQVQVALFKGLTTVEKDLNYSLARMIMDIAQDDYHELVEDIASIERLFEDYKVLKGIYKVDIDALKDKKLNFWIDLMKNGENNGI